MLKATNKNNTYFHKHASSGNTLWNKNMQNYKRTERKKYQFKILEVKNIVIAIF